MDTNLSCKTTLYADDTSISKHITDPIVSNDEIQHDLLTIEKWEDKWKLKFNPLKSEALLISRGFDKSDSIFLFQKHTVQNAKEHNLLGLIWIDNGSWKNHLSNIINKAVKRVDMMRALKYELGRSALEKYILRLSDHCLNMVVLSGIMHLDMNICSMKSKLLE